MIRARVFLAIGLVAAAAAAHADYKDDYKKGVEAIEKGKWDEGARLMRAALGSQAAEGESIKLYGMRFVPYLPQYYLGLALYKSGDCQGAVQAWKNSEGQGAVKKDSGLYKELVKNKAACETQLAESKPERKPEVKPEATKAPEPTRVAETKPPTPDPALAQARQAAEAELTRAQQAADRAAALSREPELAALWAKDGALGGKQKQALDQLASARSKLESGKDKQDVRTLNESRDLASRAARDLDAVQQEATERKQRLAQQAPRPEKTPEARATAMAAAATTAPPPELVQAARAYFAGDYRRAADALAQVEYPAGKAAAQARLFRAAARYALFVTGGQSDDSLRTAALADVQACRGLEPTLVPDAQAFSPRFVTFFTKGR
jgi:hypothetical protein